MSPTHRNRWEVEGLSSNDNNASLPVVRSTDRVNKSTSPVPRLELLDVLQECLSIFALASHVILGENRTLSGWDILATELIFLLIPQTLVDNALLD